jgi:hypothetical protein
MTPGSRDRDGYKIKIQIRDEHVESYLRELRNNFLGFNILNFFDADPNPRSLNLFDPGSGMEKFGSGAKHHRSATLRMLNQITARVNRSRPEAVFCLRIHADPDI